jgi:hypothetical protein
MWEDRFVSTDQAYRRAPPAASPSGVRRSARLDNRRHRAIRRAATNPEIDGDAKLVPTEVEITGDSSWTVLASLSLDSVVRITRTNRGENLSSLAEKMIVGHH